MRPIVMLTYKESMTDIYRNSRYYEASHVMPNHPPHGQVAPTEAASTSKSKTLTFTGPVIHKYPVEKSYTKMLSARPTLNKDVGKCLMVTPLERKSKYISGINIEF